VGTPSFVQDTPSTFGTGGPVPMQVEPPPGARPGLMGVLVDECAQHSAIAATIVDLAVRGYLHVERYTPETGLPRALMHGLPESMAAFYGAQDANTAVPIRGLAAMLMGSGWMLTMTEPPPDAEPLLAYEQALLHGIFANWVRPPVDTRPGWHFTRTDNLGTPTPSNTFPVALATLRSMFTSTARSVRSKLYSEVVSRGWFRSSPRTVHLVWYVIAWALLLGGVGTFLSWGIPSIAAVTDAWSTFGTPSGSATAVGMVVAGLVVAAFGRVMPSRTATGAALHAQAKGFRQYLLAVEPAKVGPQQQFEMFCAYLPYAMVLGVEKHWVGAFSQFAKASDGAGRTQYTTPGLDGMGRSSEDYSQLSKFAKEVGWFVKSASNNSSTGSTTT